MKPRVLFVHQWNSAGGLYGSDKVLLDFLKHAASSIDPVVVIESEGTFAELARAIPCEVIICNMGVLRQKHMMPVGLAGCGFQALRNAFWLGAVAEKLSEDDRGMLPAGTGLLLWS